MDTGYQYCTSVPFNEEAEYCYPNVVLGTAEIVFMGGLLVVLLIIVGLFLGGKAK